MSATKDKVKQDNLITFEVDGITLKAQPGSMLIEATDAAGIEIPRFCYHKKLSIAANCRMCLVEVEKVPKPLPACATPVTEGMKVFTKSPLAIQAQQGTMEFLLINHPLDCPICDQGGECDLQDISIGYGLDHSEYSEIKRVVSDQDIGPLIATEMTRCIHCTRCIRFGDEIAGVRELGATGRGENMRIGTYIKHAVSSEMSGNVIDLCPVGALISKPFLFTARAWEMTTYKSIAPHDCIGSNIQVKVRGNDVMRVDPHENEEINEEWISDRDRFSYEALCSEERLQRPMIKRQGSWQEVDWNTALQFAADGLKTVVTKHGNDALGALISPSSTLEEMFLLQKLVRGMGSNNIDHRLRQIDFSAQADMPGFPSMGQSVADLESLDSALLIGSNVRKEQPIAAHRLRKAARRGANIMFINPLQYEFNFPVHTNIGISLAGMEQTLAGIAKVLLGSSRDKSHGGIQEVIKDVPIENTHRTIAEQLKTAQRSSVLLGISAYMHPAFANLCALAAAIAQATGSTFGFLTDGANSAGAWLAGAVPHRNTGGNEASQAGLHARAMFELPRKAFLLMNLEPEYDCVSPADSISALKTADFVVSLTPYRRHTMESYADVMLPIGPFSETSGTFVNVEGRWQSFAGAVKPLGEARPGWKVLRVLGNFLDIDGFTYHSSEEVRDEVATQHEERPPSDESTWKSIQQLTGVQDGLVRIADVPIYCVDNIVRRADALLKTADADRAAAILSEKLANRLNFEAGDWAIVKQDGHQVTLPVAIDDRVPDGSVYIPLGLMLTDGLGNNGAAIELQKI